MQNEIKMVERSLKRHLCYGQRNGTLLLAHQRSENDTGTVVIKFESWWPVATRIDNFRGPWYFSLLDTKKREKELNNERCSRRRSRLFDIYPSFD